MPSVQLTFEIIIFVGNPNPDDPSPLMQTDNGILRTNCSNKGKTFGFVGDTYMPAELINSSGADGGDTVRVHSVMTPEGKWKAYNIEIIERSNQYYDDF